MPDILKAIRKIIGFINKAVKFLTNFLDGVKEFLTGIGDGIKAAIDSFPKFDFINFQKESEKTLNETENRARKLEEEFRFGFFNFGRDINESIADRPGVVEGGEVIIPNEEEQGSVVMDDDSQSGTEEGGEIDDTSGKEQITAFKDNNQDERLRIQEELEEQKVIASLKKIDEQSNKIKNIINDTKDPLTAKVENNMTDFGPSGGGDLGGTGYEAGAFAESEVNKEKRKQYEASGFDDDDISTDDTSMGTPQPGDFFVTTGGQGNKQKFYSVLQPNGKIKRLGKNKRPDGGSQFSRSEIVAAANNIKAQNIKGVSSDNRLEILSVKVHSEGENDNIFIDSKGKMNYNLEEIFKKDRPTIIFKDLNLQNSNVQMPSFSGSNGINFDFMPKKDNSLSKYHTLILDGI